MSSTETINKKKNKVTVDGNVVTLCGGSGCCPTVEDKGANMLLMDDFGGAVTLTKEQFNAMVEHYASKGSSC